MVSIYFNICLVLAIGYACLILIYFLGWLLIPEFKPARTMGYSGKRTFTILIPARNEALHIEACIASVLQQNFDPALFEIIVIDDHSTDRTAEIVKAVMEKSPLHKIALLQASQHGFSGKKEGIGLGVQRANHEVIVLTDADCTRGNNWLKTIAEFMDNNQAQMVYAPVFFTASNLFERFQSLEFAGLVGIGGAAIRLKNPNMCSAANLIFTREAFLQVGGYKDNKHIASGDDEFLLHKVFKQFPREVYFLKCRESIVYTSPNASVEQLTQQRRRWVSKSTKYENRYITAILAGAYFFNLSILANAVLGFWNAEFWYIALAQVLIKMFGEGMLLGFILRFFRRMDLLLLVPAVQPFHMIYVAVIGIWANINTYTWKDRELS